MKVQTEILNLYRESRANPSTTASPFQTMLESHLQTARQDMTRQGLGRLLYRESAGGDFGSFINNIAKIKDVDEGYFKKAVKKQSLAEGFENRFGAKVEERFKKFKPLIESKADKYGIDPNLLAALVKQESNFNPYAVSSCGAMGLGQIMPGTARYLGVKDPFNAAQNLDGAAKYLREMLDKFGRTDFALAAYNAGPGAVQKYGGIPPYKETQGYVKAIRSHYKVIAGRENFGKSLGEA